jgi:hypothetical protein
LLKKNKLRKNIIRVIEDRLTNWQEKAQFIENTLAFEEHFEEVYLDLVRKQLNSKYRKNAASLLAYMENTELVKQLIDQIFKEPAWIVRYPLAQAYSKHFGDKAVDLLLEQFNNLTKDADPKHKHRMRMILAEALGLLGLHAGIPILKAIIDEVGNDRNKYARELIIQCLYSLGEIGDLSIVEFLLKYSAESQFTTELIRNSASHAIDKIAKKLRFSSKKTMLEELHKSK